MILKKEECERIRREIEATTPSWADTPGEWAIFNPDLVQTLDLLDTITALRSEVELWKGRFMHLAQDVSDAHKDACLYADAQKAAGGQP
jgi:hypothetical protein